MRHPLLVPSVFVLLLGGCSEEPAVADGRAPDVVVREVLQRCHGVLQGSEKMARSLVELRRDPDGEAERVYLGEGSRMRRTMPDQSIDVRLPQGGFHVTPHGVVEGIDGEALARLDRFQALLRGALLAPLYGAERTTRRGEMYDLFQPGGAVWHLRVATASFEGERFALPSWLSGPPGEIAFREHLHTGPTHLPKAVRLGEFGEYHLALRSSDVRWDDAVFTDPRSGEEPTRTVDVGYTSRPPWDTPELHKVGAMRCLVFPDPGTWEGRIAAIAPSAARLRRQGQWAAGLHFLFDEGDVRHIAMPFAMRPDESGKPFVAEKDQRVIRLEAHTAIVLYPKPGTLAACEASARRQLEDFVARNKLQVTGPLRMAPYIMWENAKGGSAVEDLDELTIHFELPVREP